MSRLFRRKSPQPQPQEIAGQWSSSTPEDSARVVKVLELLRAKNERTVKDIEELYAADYGNGESADIPGGYHQRADLLIDRFRPQPAVIYHPGSHLDLGVAKRHPHTRVMHVDKEQWVIDLMQQGGYEAHAADHNQFIPDTAADVTILFNAGRIPNDQLLKVTQHDGLVVVNNYHYAATYMALYCPDFKLVGAIEPDDPLTILSDFDMSRLGVIPAPNEIVWPAYADTIFAFQRQASAQ